MTDPFVSFSTHHSMDIFPSFKSFQQPKDDPGAFTIDKKDVEEIKSDIPTTTVQKTNKSKRNNATSSTTTKKTTSNPLAQCDICLVPISSQIVYDTHIKGKKHQTQYTALLSKNPQYKPLTYEELCSKKSEPTVVNIQNEKPEGSIVESVVKENNVVPPLIPSKKLNCNICNVSCNSQQMFDNHVGGKKHQTKLKSDSFTNPAPPLRVVPDNNPSSSNYCDICSIKLNSEDELTEHLAQKRHQTRVKDAEYCAKEAIDMNINFDDYKPSTTDTEKDSGNYQCTTCDKKFRNKIQLIEHLKSAPHIRLSTQPKIQPKIPHPSKNSNRENRQTTRGGTVKRGGIVTRGQSFSSFRGSSKPSGRSRPYRPQSSSWNRPSRPLDQHFNQQTSNNLFGAFDPDNQSTLPSNNNYYSSTKRSTPYEDPSNEYSGFYPKRTRTYIDQDNPSQDFYSTGGDYYPSSTLENYPSNSNNYSSEVSNYNNQSSIPQPPWQYPTEPYYDPQQYSNPESGYTNPIYYPTNQPPLPNYEPPPLPSYPPPSSHSQYPQTSTFLGSTENQGNNNYFPDSFRH